MNTATHSGSVADMERASFNQEDERLITSEEKERLSRALASLGLVDAMLCDQPLTREHPEDRKWAIILDREPYSNCELGYD